MKKITFGLKIVSVIVLSLLLFSCNPLEKDYKSNSFIIIQSIIGKDAQGNDSTVVFSDVQKNNLVYPDFVTITLKAALLDPKPINGVSQYNDIMLTKYVVTYLRADSVFPEEGVTVPYHFEGSLSQLLPIGTNVSIPLMIVRDSAKLAPPLSDLVSDPTSVLECVAKIELFGHDMNNKEVSQIGYISVRFANYPDE